MLALDSLKGREVIAAGGGGQRWEGVWLHGALRPGLNDVQGWRLGGTALHTISISLQNSFCELHTWRLVSWKALRALNAQRALTVYAVFEDKKSTGSDQKSVKRKIALEKSDRTNIAKNFVWEQFKQTSFESNFKKSASDDETKTKQKMSNESNTNSAEARKPQVKMVA